MGLTRTSTIAFGVLMVLASFRSRPSDIANSLKSSESETVISASASTDSSSSTSSVGMKSVVEDGQDERKTRALTDSNKNVDGVVGEVYGTFQAQAQDDGIVQKPTQSEIAQALEGIDRLRIHLCSPNLYGKIRKQNRNIGTLWTQLCKGQILEELIQKVKDPQLSTQNPIQILQVGAHTGWEANDPFIRGISRVLNYLPKEFRTKYVEYVFVEASPQVYPTLKQNVDQHSSLCRMKAIHGGIVPDAFVGKDGSSEPLTFYSIHSDIDVVTGKDKRTGTKLQFWVTQLGSFNYDVITSHNYAFQKRGLSIYDYLVETKIQTIPFSSLLNDQTLFVLVDTEGFDCDIISGVDPYAKLPRFLLYEVKHCKPDMRLKAEQHMINLGYKLNGEGQTKGDYENMIGVRVNTTTTNLADQQ